MLFQIDTFPTPVRNGAGKRLGEQPSIHPTTSIRDCKIGSWTEIGPFNMLAESSFDDYSYTSEYVDVIYSEIGKFCSIARNVRINPGNHPMHRVTQHHCTYRRARFGFGEADDAEFFAWRRAHKCVVGHDVWIGHGAVILPGVTVGTGAVIGAGAVVSKDVEPYEIVVGVPARPIRKRFPEEVIEALLAIAWWDWDRATIEERFEDLMDTPRFVEKYSPVRRV